MGILVIDDQKLVVTALQKRLYEYGFEVKTANSVEEGIVAYNSFDPDLVLLDMNMPEISGSENIDCMGIEVVKYIRLFLKRDTPILVISGNTSSDIVARNLDLGVNGYLAKPISIDKVVKNVNNLLGTTKIKARQFQTKDFRAIKKNGLGLVIPCYNDEEKLLSEEFETFAQNNIGYHLYFVNDGSTDNTLQLLYGIRYGNETNITVINLKNHLGKGNAIREGILSMTKNIELNYIGYADLLHFSNFNSIEDIVDDAEDLSPKIINETKVKPKFKVFKLNNGKILFNMTSRLIRTLVLGIFMGDSTRSIIILERKIARKIFETEFTSRFSFDLELSIRIKNFYLKYYSDKGPVN